jgi:hypothetical protein
LQSAHGLRLDPVEELAARGKVEAIERGDFFAGLQAADPREVELVGQAANFCKADTE